MKLTDIKNSAYYIPFYLETANKHGINSPQRQQLNKLELPNVSKTDKEHADKLLTALYESMYADYQLENSKKRGRGVGEAKHKAETAEEEFERIFNETPHSVIEQVDIICDEIQNKPFLTTLEDTHAQPENQSKGFQDVVNNAEKYTKIAEIFGDALHLYDGGQEIIDGLEYVKAVQEENRLKTKLDSMPEYKNDIEKWEVKRLPYEMELQATSRMVSELSEKYPRVEDEYVTLSTKDFPDVEGKEDLEASFGEELSEADYEKFAAELEMLRDDGLVR